jgi:Ser/Thr protein kinase RdoA (MazF antagonist)
MRFEPPVDRLQLLEAARDACGIPARDLTFLPVGLEAACYVLSATDGSYFLKLWPHLRLGQQAAARRLASLVLTRALHDRGLGLRVPYPITTRDGALWADLSGMPFVVAPLLSGAAPRDPWPPGFCAELGRTVATIHRATRALADLLPLPESLDVAFVPTLLRDIEVAARITPDARPGLLALRDWVTGRRDGILAKLARLHELQATVRRLDGPVVLCHTDLHDANLLVDDDGRIGILDWDDAKLAPPEHDLWAGLGEDHRGEGFDAFLQAYRSANGAAPLHLEHFAFYLLRRYLEDLAVNLGRLLDPDADEREDPALLHSMEAWSIARWSRLDETLRVIATALRQDGR